MGIHGLFKELAPSITRQSLAKFAADHYLLHSRPLILAIDISIWLFQIQASRGGSNPALRTFYYRLLRLLTLNIHPLFVFDGPNKPLWKRNKRVGAPGGGSGGAGHVRIATVPEFLAKQLLKHFGFPMHVAPGEAEAECALLQREGIVDAVLSEDVDTLMFGSGVLLRNWTAEGAVQPNRAVVEGEGDVGARKKKSTSSKTPTYVTIYRTNAIQEKTGLDKEGMVLVALMSGGDYIVEGIPGCGPKTACDAARAGFGKELCALAARKDHAGIASWREKIRHQFRTNEDKLLSKKRPSLASAIPDDFPNMEILGYYTHPCVSNTAALTKLRNGLKWDQPIDFVALRDFAGDAFDWRCLGGAKKFVRNLAPAMLVRELRLYGEAQGIEATPDEREVAERALANAIHGKRNHASADGDLEYSISYIPINLVPIDLSIEDEDDQFTAAGELSGTENELAPMPSATLALDGEAAPSPTKKARIAKPYDPDQPDKLWILQTFVQLGCPLMLEDYEAKSKDAGAKKARSKNARAKPATKRGSKKKGSDMPPNAIMRYATTSKPGTRSQSTTKEMSIGEESGSEADVHSWSISVDKQPAPLGLSARALTVNVPSGPHFKLPSTQIPEKYRDLTASPPLLPRALPLSKGVPAVLLDDDESDVAAKLGAKFQFQVNETKQSDYPSAQSGLRSSKDSKTQSVSTSSDRCSPSDPQRTPRRSKRTAVASPSPALSQRTIDSYWSPSVSKPRAQLQHEHSTQHFSKANTTQRVTSVHAARIDIEVIDLLSSSPAHNSESAGRTVEARDQCKDVTVAVLRDIEPNSVANILDRNAFEEKEKEWTLPPGVTPRRRHKRLRRNVKDPGKARLQRAETAPVTGIDHGFDDWNEDRDSGSEADRGGGFLLDTDRIRCEGLDLDLNLELSMNMDLARTPRLLFGEKAHNDCSARFLVEEPSRPDADDDDEDNDLPEACSIFGRKTKQNSTRSRRDVPLRSPRRPLKSNQSSAPECRDPSLAAGGKSTTATSKPHRTSGNDSTDTDAVRSNAQPRRKPSLTSNAALARSQDKSSTMCCDVSDVAVSSSAVQSNRCQSTFESSALPPEIPKPKKKVILPRDSLPGFFKEVEIDAVDLSGDGSGWKVSGGRAAIFGTVAASSRGRDGAKNARAFRQSAVEVLDLTGA